MRFAILAPLALAACATLPERPALELAPMDRTAREAIERLNYQGAALIVGDQGLLWRLHSGAVDCTPEGRRIGPADRFDMGSLTKLFTAALIVRLSERGDLSLDARLGDLLPDVPSDKADITVSQLLMHRSGLREASGDDEDHISRDAMLAQEFAAPLAFAPGTDQAYSNVGYSVLAAIVERRTGLPYEQVLRRELLDPFGADSIGYMHRPRSGADVCGWWDGRARPRYGSVRDYFVADGPSWNLVGNGALLTTPEDLALWYHALVTGRVLGPRGTAIFQQAMAQEWSGRPVYLSSGSNIVFTSFIAHCRDTGLTFLMMSNDSRTPKERAMFFFDQGLNAVMDELDPPQ